MKKLPSRGWGLFREEFYSYHSFYSAQQADTEHKFGVWRNVWIARLSAAVYKASPKLWRWWMNR